jgi:hypothetical protein
MGHFYIVDDDFGAAKTIVYDIYRRTYSLLFLFFISDIILLYCIFSKKKIISLTTLT